MSDSDSTTVEFQDAAEEFDAASEQIHQLREHLFELHRDLDTTNGQTREIERTVAGSPAVQNREEGAPHNAETRTARTVELLAADPDFLELMEATEQLREDISDHEANLERWRDRRSLARRRMDYVIALTSAGKEDDRA